MPFSVTLRAQGMGLLDATLRVCRQRLRPILMTSLAFGLGVLQPQGESKRAVLRRASVFAASRRLQAN